MINKAGMKMGSLDNAVTPKGFKNTNAFNRIKALPKSVTPKKGALKYVPLKKRLTKKGLQTNYSR